PPRHPTPRFAGGPIDGIQRCRPSTSNRLTFLRSAPARGFLFAPRALRQEVFEKLCCAPEALPLTVADKLDETNQFVPAFAGTRVDGNDMAAHRRVPVVPAEIYGVSHSHSMSSQQTRSVTQTTLNLPLPLMPLKGPVPPSSATVP